MTALSGNDDKFKNLHKLNFDLSKIVRREIDVIGKCAYEDVQNGVTEKLETEQFKLQDPTFNVLVMGMFSSGKSAFLNGLLGDRILPMKALPTTAIIGEISYSDKERIILLPKKGKWPKTGDKPFDISRDELADYITIDNDKDEREESPFDKVYIKTPLGICRNGVVLVDSPGLNDPTDHEKETEIYQNNADTIIYCMDSQTPFTKLDKMKIEELSALGYKSIIFVFTKIDLIERNDEDNDTRDAEMVRRSMLQKMAGYTELGQDGVFFVNSMGAINGKRKNDNNKLQNSGFAALENKLTNFLVQHKGRLKLVRSLYTLRRVNIGVRQYLSDQISIRSQERETLERNQQKAQGNYDRAQAEMEYVKKQIDSEVVHIVRSMGNCADIFVSRLIQDKVAEWINNFEPETNISLNPLKIKSTAQEYGREIQEYFQSQMKIAVSQWLDEQTESVILNLSRTLNRYNVSMQNISSELQDLRECLGLPKIREEGFGPSKWEQLVSIAAGLLVGDLATAVTGGIFGYKGALRAAGFQLAGGAVLGMIGLLFPIGIPAIIITAILAAIAGGFTNMITLKSNIKDSLIKKLTESLNGSRAAFVSDTEAAAEEAVKAMIESIKYELESPLRAAKAHLDAASDALRGSGPELEKKLSIYKMALQESSDIDSDLNDDRFAV